MVNSHQQTQTVGIKQPLPAAAGSYRQQGAETEVKEENQYLSQLLIKYILQIQLHLVF